MNGRACGSEWGETPTRQTSGANKRAKKVQCEDISHGTSSCLTSVTWLGACNHGHARSLLGFIGKGPFSHFCELQASVAPSLERVRCFRYRVCFQPGNHASPLHRFDVALTKPACIVHRAAASEFWKFLTPHSTCASCRLQHSVRTAHVPRNYGVLRRVLALRPQTRDLHDCLRH
ncbi:hypothetical protein T440DRAFT_34410 [Plenodomus tracheiphilus IPT5]|uniref:Uncharacterized protein n=1 Tax=Plenodomus tracheiphilus IPT5 TaxID=1408161 RepID=A0A6A7BDA9_9PLEO|nr:hypothetical protein T440DRAFT_34410 [Plenodomus tracheiphilus IPT5]